jgi:hypothetical protein
MATEPEKDAFDELRALLGGRLARYLSDGPEGTVAAALAIAQQLCETDPPDVVQAWFQGMNPALDGRSPAHALRDGSLDEVRTAANAFRAFG